MITVLSMVCIRVVMPDALEHHYASKAIGLFSVPLQKQQSQEKPAGTSHFQWLGSNWAASQGSSIVWDLVASLCSLLCSWEMPGCPGPPVLR